MSLADVDAGVRRAIATYVHALDDGDTEGVVATFTADGTVEMPMGSHTGHDALRAAYDGWKPRGPQRHLVLNTAIVQFTDDTASSVSDFVFLAKGEAWGVQLVGRYVDELVRDGDRWLFVRRTATFS